MLTGSLTHKALTEGARKGVSCVKLIPIHVELKIEIVEVNLKLNSNRRRRRISEKKYICCIDTHY